jgi:hypothetical protein
MAALPWLAAPRGAGSRPRGSLRLTHLRGSKTASRQARVAKPHLDFDDAIAAYPRARRQCQTSKNELKMSNLQPLRGEGDLAVGGEARGVKVDAERMPSLGGGQDEHGSLNLKHVDLCNERIWISPSGKHRDVGYAAIKEVQASEAHGCVSR